VTVYAALLRGVNLGARNRVAMPALREVLEDLGYRDVATYVQSGNVVFGAPGREASVRGAVEAAMRRAFGLTIPVLLRSREQLRSTTEHNPFLRRGVDPATLHVSFLDAKPAAARVRALGERAFAPDDVAVRGRDVYLRCPNGYGRSKLGNAFLEERLGAVATTRNWKTVRTLLELADAR
jgi:uncharacterized protein (DUF1697 family)